jgi:hypothetical protein
MSNNRYDRRTVRRMDADDRHLAWENLSFQEQLNHLDSRLGKDLGAKKQRNRIHKKIEKGATK